MNKKSIIDIVNQQNAIEYNETIKSILEKCVIATLEQKGINFPVAVSIVLVDNERIMRLNSDYRGVNKETDVLSFPMLELDPMNQELQRDDFVFEVDPQTQTLVLGDIVISLQMAAHQGEKYGHGFFRELGFLTIHGMLHLLGHDHEEEDESSIMRELEEKILFKLNLSRE